MDIVYFLKALLKKKWLIMLSTMAAVALAFVFTMGRPRLYVSSAQMATGFTTNDQIRLREEGQNPFEADVKFDNVIQTITSPIVISLISYELIIHDLTSPKPFKQLNENERKDPAASAISKDQVLAIAQGKLDSLSMLSSYVDLEKKMAAYLRLYGYDYESIKNNLNVGRVARTDYIDIVYKSSHPEQSAFVVNNLYKNFVKFHRSSRSERSVENIETFEALVNQKKTELDTKVEALKSYKSSEGLLDVEAASTNQMALISQFEKNVYDENANLNTLRASLTSIDEQLERIKNGQRAYESNNGEIITLRRQINETYADFVASGSTDAKLEAKLKDLRKQLQEKNGSATKPSNTTINREDLEQKKISLQAQIRAIEMNLANLDTKLRQLKGTVGSYASKEANVSGLQQEVAMAQDEYTKLKEKLNAALDNKTAQPDNFRQTLKGQPALRPESSKRIIILGMTGLSIFLIAALGIVFREFMDSSMKSPSLYNKSVDIKLIGTINYADIRKRYIIDVLQQEDIDPKTKKIRQNTFRELLRKVRYELESSGKQIFLFTSTVPQQGKTTLVQALAYSLGLSNKKVLIIDTNFCNNDLTVQLQANPTLETFSCPPGEFSIDKVTPFITTFENGAFDVIGCKGGDYTPSEILPENNLLMYLPQLKNYYDYILLEGAPLNDYTDSKELVRYADGVIAVFSSRQTVHANDRESIEFLHSLDSKLVGAVLNKVEEDYLEL